MKQTMLVAAASAAIGAAAALIFSPNAPPPARTAAPLDVRALQVAMERALESVGFGSQARATQAAGTDRAPRDGAPPAPAESNASGRYVEREGREIPVEELPPADRPMIDSVRSFSEDETLRRKWLFRSERDVIAWLGTPDAVVYEDGGERWHYQRSDGKLLIAFFARGRLLQIMD